MKSTHISPSSLPPAMTCLLPWPTEESSLADHHLTKPIVGSTIAIPDASPMAIPGTHPEPYRRNVHA
jgi:hypothetical protein